MDNIIHGESAFYYDLVKKENVGEMLIGLMQELLITVSNSAYLTITSGVLNNTLFTDKIYWNHEFSTTQKTTTATSIKVKWGFDGFSGYKKLS